METNERQGVMADVQAKLAVAEAQMDGGLGRPLEEVLRETQEKYGD